MTIEERRAALERNRDGISNALWGLHHTLSDIENRLIRTRDEHASEIAHQEERIKTYQRDIADNEVALEAIDAALSLQRPADAFAPGEGRR